MVRKGDDENEDDFSDGDEKKGPKLRPSTPPPVLEVGDDPAETITPVIESFMVERWQQEVGDDATGELLLTASSVPAYATTESVDDAASMGAAAPLPPPGRRQPTSEQRRRYTQVAHQLNEVALSIENDYSPLIDSLVNELHLSSTSVAYEAFERLARGIISHGINWARVLVIILFGWRVLKMMYGKFGGGGFLESILNYILKFITEHVLNWICQRGGWGDLFRHTTSDLGTVDASVLSYLSDPRVLGAAAVLVACAAATAFFLSRRK